MKLKSLILLLSLFTGLLFSQTATRDHSNMETSNLWALQFQILDNFRLSSFEGSTISLKRKLSDCTSIRFGLSINSSINDLDQENRIVPITNSHSNSSQDNDQFNFSITSLYLWNTIIKNDVSVYYGIGPLFSYGYNKSKNRAENINNEIISISENVTSQNTFGFGASCVIGIEWFVKDNISLSGEYETYASYYLTNRKSENSSSTSAYRINDEISENIFRFQSAGVKLGVSVHF